MLNYPIRVLFLCTGNSARSQIAEGFLRDIGGKDFSAFSAGSAPKGMHPMTVKVMAEHHIDVSNQQSQHISEFINQHFDYIITVCDRAKDTCPVFPGDNKQIHWSYPDPAAEEGEEEQLHVFRQTALEMRERIRAWVETQRKLLKEQGVAG